MRKNPVIMGTAVPIEKKRRNADVFLAKNKRGRVENRKGENPKPDMTRPVAVAHRNETMVRRKDKLKGESRSHRLIRECVCCRADGSCNASASPCAGHIPAEGEERYSNGGDCVCGCRDASVEDVTDA